MHALPVIKQACTDALDEGGTGSAKMFYSVVDPASVLEMATAIEMLLTYMEKVDDLTAQELVREIRHRINGGGAEGAV